MKQTHQLSTDIAVVGGGMAGVCAAIAAARHGARVVIIQDRPVLGGNSSSEVRVHVTGADCSGGRPHARESGIIEELRLEEAVRNPQRAATMWDLILWEAVTAEPNITLLLNTNLTGVNMAGPALIDAIYAARESTQDRYQIMAPLFLDATGDGRLGAEAGADFRYGREGVDEHNEPHAQGPDDKTMGCSILWQARDMGQPMPFTPPPFARIFETCEDLPHRGHAELGHGHWWVEYGGELNIVKDYEAIRDELLACMMGVWDHVKNRCPAVDATNWALTWFSFVPGKRESRRLLGDHILSENDLLGGVLFPDAVCHGGWPIDTHPPGGIHSPEPPCDFIGTPDVYGIPLRSLYSRNVNNLLMAGRNASCTHMAMASTRVMATCAVMGQAAGTAAALAISRDCLPRDVAERHIVELQQALLRDDCYIPGVIPHDPLDILGDAIVSASSEAAGSPATSTRNGLTRCQPDATNQWASAPGEPLPQWLQFDLPRPRRIVEIHITFDSGFARPLCLTQSDQFNSRMTRGPQPETVRAYRVEGFVEGQWQLLAAEGRNHQRKKIHRTDEFVSALRITILATNGDSQARVFEVRGY